MPQSLAAINVHFIWSTKNRSASIAAPVASRLHPYMGGILRAEKCVALAIGGMNDHVHLLVSLSREITVADLVRVVKAGSSKWMHENGHADFQWQTGYGAFSVSQSNVDSVRSYIANQAEHHRKVSFQEEYVAFLKKHGLSYDERYLWD